MSSPRPSPPPPPPPPPQTFPTESNQLRAHCCDSPPFASFSPHSDKLLRKHNTPPMEFLSVPVCPGSYDRDILRTCVIRSCARKRHHESLFREPRTLPHPRHCQRVSSERRRLCVTACYILSRRKVPSPSMTFVFGSTKQHCKYI